MKNKSIKFISFKKRNFKIDYTVFFTDIIKGLENQCTKENVEVGLMTIEENENMFPTIKRISEDKETGLVILATEMADEDMDLFSEFENPIVLVDAWDPQMRYDSISVFNEQGAERAVNELIKRGHTNIGYLKGSYRVRSFKEREDAYFKTLRKHNLDIVEEYIWELNASIEGAFQDALVKLEESKTLPTAFFADDDLIALGAMKAIQSKGIAIPDDVSIIGFDDLPYAKFSSPNLSSMKTPAYQIGQMAALKIMELMEKKSVVKSRIQIAPLWMERESIAPKR